MSRADSRDDILARVRARLGHDPAQFETRRRAALETIAARRQHPRPRLDGDLRQRFCARALALAASVDSVHTLAQAPAAIARYLAAAGLPASAVCWAAFAGLDWAAAGLQVAARGAGPDDAVGITGCSCALAETGTLMLLSGIGMAATTSLLPETHIALVPASRIVASMEEGFALLRAEQGAPPRAVTFISGPSRTGDIEQTTVLGAHGPYRVHLLIVDDE